MIRELTHINMEEILPLYASVGWTNYTQKPDMLQQALAHSLKILADYEDGRLVGLTRAVGDGHSILYIQDILVHPDYQRCGIGSALLRTLLADYSHVYQKVLLTDDTEKTRAFYGSMGFMPSSDFHVMSFMRNY